MFAEVIRKPIRPIVVEAQTLATFRTFFHPGDRRHIPAILQKMEFRVPTHQQCTSAWLRGGIAGGAARLTPRHICAAALLGEGHGVCQGDSGGPLQCFTNDNRWTLAGVASFVKYCGSNDYPNVYARATVALDWIERVKRNRTPNL